MLNVIKAAFGTRRRDDLYEDRPWQNVELSPPVVAPEAVPEAANSDAFLSPDALDAMTLDDLLGEHRGIVSIKVDLSCELEKLLSYERSVQEVILCKTATHMADYGIRISGEIITR